jgi:16S rRNA (guanine(527)-N(7))-methyltransferase RsmG
MAQGGPTLSGSRHPSASISPASEIREAFAPYLSDPMLKPFLTEAFFDSMSAFGSALALWGQKVNLTARPDDPAQVAFHVIDSLMPLVLARSQQIAELGDVFGCGKRILDLGSGAGFPALVLANACGAHFTLTEARRRRVSFLKVAAVEMALDNVEILGVRVSTSTLAPVVFNAVLSRASGPLPGFYQLAAHALAPGGAAILYASPSQRLDLAAAEAAGLGAYRRHRYRVWRPGAAVERVLAVWRVAEKST